MKTRSPRRPRLYCRALRRNLQVNGSRDELHVMLRPLDTCPSAGGRQSGSKHYPACPRHTQPLLTGAVHKGWVGGAWGQPPSPAPSAKGCPLAEDFTALVPTSSSADGCSPCQGAVRREKSRSQKLLPGIRALPTLGRTGTVQGWSLGGRSSLPTVPNQRSRSFNRTQW